MSTPKIQTITPAQLQGYIHEIVRQMYHLKFTPDYIVGITRGGLVPAVMLSQHLDIPMHTLNISFRDGDNLGPESNLWMAEDAFGYNQDAKNILIVDDINDTGRTLQWIKDDWQSGCLPNDPQWIGVWHHNVKFATIVDNEASEFKGVDFTGLTINLSLIHI